MPIHNFHESDVPHRISREGRLQRIESDPNRITNTDFFFSAHGRDSFSLMKGSSELPFRFVGDAERWVSDSVIASTFQDAMGSNMWLLYEIAGDIGEIVSPAPKWRLTRLTPAACK